MTKFTPRSIREINQAYLESAPQVPAIDEVVVEEKLVESMTVPLGTSDIVEPNNGLLEADAIQVLPQTAATLVPEPILPADIAIAPDPVAQVAAFDALADNQPKQSRFRSFMRLVGILLWIATVILLLLTTFGFLTRNNDVSKFGNYGVFYQRSENMEPDVGYGSLLIGPLMDKDSGRMGNDVVFTLDQPDGNKSVELRRITAVVRTNSDTSYDTIVTTDRENSHEVFEGNTAVMKKAFGIPGLGLLIDWLTENVWWVIGAFMLSLFLVTVFRPRQRA